MFKKLAIPVLVVFLAGCAGLQIDTMNKRLAAFEVSYSETLKAVERVYNEGRLSQSDALAVADGIEEIEKARVVMYAALAAGDVAASGDALTMAIEALTVMREYAVRAEQ